MFDMDPSLSPGVSSTISDTPTKSSNFLKIKNENDDGSRQRSVSAKPQVARRNERERNRVRQVNNGFVTLRNHIPSTNSKSKKLSKVETLRAAASYIQHLRQLLDADHFSTNINGQSMPNLLAQTLQTYADAAAAASSHDHQSSAMASSHFGNGGGSMIGATGVAHLHHYQPASNYYNANFAPHQNNYGTLVDGNNYGSNNLHYKVSPSTTHCDVSPQNGYVSDPGYDYVASPPEIKQYHTVGDFTVMPSY